MKSQRISWPKGLGPSNYIWTNWTKKTYPAISPEPWLQFLQRRPHFLENLVMNPIKFWNLKKIIDFWVWGLETRFARVLLLYWPFINNWMLRLLKLSSCLSSNRFSFSRNLTCSFKFSNFSNNEGSDSSFFALPFSNLLVFAL